MNVLGVVGKQRVEIGWGRLSENSNVIYRVNASLIIKVLLVVVAVLGLATVGLAVRSSGAPQTQTLIETAYLTQTEVETQTETQLSLSTITESSTVADQGYPSSYYPSSSASSWYSPVTCTYPFNPYICNEGPPQTITGYLTNDTTCVDLYVGGEETYVVWNLPQTYPDGAYQIYGFVYPNWPGGQAFPPYPFQQTVCEGIPLWAISPYVQGA